MLIRTGFDIRFETDVPVPMLALLSVHPDRQKDLRTPEILVTSPHVPARTFEDRLGNICTRLTVPAGGILLSSDFVIEDDGRPDSIVRDAPQHPIEDLPDEVLFYLMSSRYCEVSLLADEAWKLARDHNSGWDRVQALVAAAHDRIEFDYQKASTERTAYTAYQDRVGVCRDYAHLAITLCRAINVPARYCAGYLGEIGVAPNGAPMDFSAWFEAYLGGRWHTFDARNNRPRTGRIVMARGRDATDTAITTSFGRAKLVQFDVHTDEVNSINLSKGPKETSLSKGGAGQACL